MVIQIHTVNFWNPNLYEIRTVWKFYSFWVSEIHTSLDLRHSKLPRHDIPKNNYRLNETITFCYCVVSFHVVGQKSFTADPWLTVEMLLNCCRAALKLRWTTPNWANCPKKLQNYLPLLSSQKQPLENSKTQHGTTHIYSLYHLNWVKRGTSPLAFRKLLFWYLQVSGSCKAILVLFMADTTQCLTSFNF